MEQIYIKNKTLENNHRSVVKSITYRMLSITADSIAAYFFTHNVVVSAGIVAVVNGYSTILYYFHERIWSHIHWGRRKTD